MYIRELPISYSSTPWTAVDDFKAAIALRQARLQYMVQMEQSFQASALPDFLELKPQP